MQGYSDTQPFVIDDAIEPAARVAVMRFVAERGAHAPIARRLAELVRHRAGPGASPYKVASEALRVAQRAGYVRADEPEYFRPVAYTAVHGGDCEDLTPLLAAIATNLGIPWHIEWIDQPEQALNHVALKLRVDGAWLWADPSVCGARLGEDPYAAIERLGQWYVIDATRPGGACAVE